jgi:hypothetical protein
MPNDIIDAIESDVTALAERDDLTADDLCLLLTKLDGIAKRTRDAKAQLENFLLTWLPTQPVKELQIGEVRYYVGPKTKEKCRNVPAAVTALYEAATRRLRNVLRLPERQRAQAGRVPEAAGREVRRPLRNSRGA